jgi:Cu+-exporting ATPase
MSTKTPLPVASAPPAAKPSGAGRHLALEITGMTCASCVRRVERALEHVPGVAAATVNLAAASADVTVAQPVEPGALITAVTGAGYQAAVPATVRADDVGRRRAAQAAWPPARCCRPRCWWWPMVSARRRGRGGCSWR